VWRRKWLLIIFFSLLLPYLSFSIDVSLVYLNGTQANLSYDRFNVTLGSFSYKDNSIVNPNVYVKICNLNESFNGTLVDLLYSSESGNITVSILTEKPQIYNVSGDCSILDIDVSAFKALYPAVPFFAMYKLENSTNVTNTTYLRRVYFTKMNDTILNGSYLVGVDIDDVTKQTFLSVQKIFDQNHQLITNSTKPYLIFTIVLDGKPVKERITAPFTQAVFDYQFHSSEIVYVNGIPSLKVKVIPPCTVVNETGYYYVINSSSWNVNQSCLKVKNVTNIVIDFANKTIDGDAYINGSYNKDVCGIIVENSTNLTLKDVRANQFYRGICIINSENIKIFGTGATANMEGIYLKNSTVKISAIWLSNMDSEITSEDDSIINLNNVHFLTANISASAKDVRIKNVFSPPKDPPGLINISQWINISKNNVDSWLNEIKFHFIFPNPQGVIPKTIYKFDGLLINDTWVNGTWVELIPNYVDIANRVIFSPLNLTNFSIFAPYGEKVNVTVPKPVPKPTPTPAPSAVGGGAPKAIPPKLKLELINKTITLQQGETGRIWFNLTNIGDADVYDVRVDAKVRKGWERTFKDFDVVRRNETKTDSILISVYENEIPGTYWVPIKALLKKNNVTVDVKLLKVIVIPRKRVARVDILEIPPFLSLPEYSSTTIGILVKNTGDYDLNDVRLRIENGEKCISRVDGTYSLKVGEKKSLGFTLHTKSGPRKCHTVFVLESDRGPVALYPVIIQVVPSLRAKTIFYFVKVLPILLIVWTIILIWVWRRKK